MEQLDLVVRGNLVLENEVVHGELGIQQGKIVTIRHDGGEKLKGKEVKDFNDSYVFPGAIDVHVHCYSNPAEGFISTSASAAAGGVTTFIDMPYDLPNPVNHVDRFNAKVEKLEEEALVDIALWGTIAKRKGTDQIIPLAEAGAASFKMSTFETDEYRFPRIPDPEILKAMTLIKETGLLAAFHSENDEIIFDLIDSYEKSNQVYPRAHTETRPPVTETSAVLKLLEFAYWTGVNLHIVHVSHPRTLELIRQFKAQGVKVTCETCHPYLLLQVEDLDKFGPKAKMNPPLRYAEDVEGMWKHLLQGEIDMISSDHIAWKPEQKDAGNDNIFRAASGLPGLDILAPLMFDSLVASGKMSPIAYAKLLSQHPAEIFKLRNKGKIAVGYDADFMVIDPKGTHTVDETKFQGCSKMSPFHGRKLAGKIVHSIVRGTVVYDGEQIRVEPGFGQFVPGFYAKESVRAGRG